MPKGSRGGSKGGGGAAKNSALVNGVPESQQKDFYYHVDAASTRTLDGKIYSVDEWKMKYQSVLVNENLPNIEGVSEKQTNYAKTLLVRNTNRFINNFESRIPGDPHIEAGREKRAAAIDKMISQTNSAGGKAKSYSDVVNFMVNNSPQSPLVWAKKHPTAREIIDRFG